jgi:hypothetical protein
MPDEYTPNSYQGIVTRYFSECGVSDEQFGTVDLGYRRVVTNPVDRRVKPKALLLNQTAQPLQFRENCQYDLYKVKSYRGRPYFYCPDKHGTYKEITTHSPVPNYYVSTPTYPDWTMDARNKVKSLAVNLGASVAEYRETASMFKKAGIGFRDAIRVVRNLRKGKWRKRLSTREIAQAELAFSFGVMPLVNDLHDSFYALQDRISNSLYRRIYVSKKERDVFSNVDDKWSGLWESSVRAHLIVRLNANYSDFTMGNPLEIAWELVPFSFVLDWAIPIGEYLSSLDALKDVDMVHGTVTRKLKYQHVSTSPFWDENPRMKVGKYSRDEHERYVVNSIPFPPLPGYDPSDSLRAIGHGLSLMRSLKTDKIVRWIKIRK